MRARSRRVEMGTADEDVVVACICCFFLSFLCFFVSSFDKDKNWNTLFLTFFHHLYPYIKLLSSTNDFQENIVSWVCNICIFSKQKKTQKMIRSMTDVVSCLCRISHFVCLFSSRNIFVRLFVTGEEENNLSFRLFKKNILPFFTTHTIP